MSDPRQAVDPLIGRTIGGRYRLIQRLGTGGTSSVYLTRHVLIDRLMAIKTLRRDLAQDPVQRDRFLREARAVNRINHANIVEITDVGETEDGLPYLIMEYVPGEALRQVMKREGPFPPQRAFDIAKQVGSALARAHQMGVIHRDLKPENILLVQRRDQPDFVKILDFGIAKILDAPSLTLSQQIFGTPGYIAPEYIQSTDIDGRVDLYSLGVILYEMVTGALPFDYEYPGDLLVKHVTEPPIPPSRRRPGLPRSVEQFVLRCLAKDPADRFRDAHHFLEALRAAREPLGPDTVWGAVDGPARAAEKADPLDDSPTPPVSPLPALHDRVRTPPEVGGFSSAQSPTGRPPTSDVAAARTTAEYARPHIPEPPRDELELDIVIDVGAQRAQEAARQTAGHAATTSSAPKPSADGLLGVRRWRRRFDAIRGALDELAVVQPAPAEIERAMAFAAHTLEKLEDSVVVVESRQASLESIGERARDFRSTLGGMVDELASELSRRRGELEVLVGHRRELVTKREALRESARSGTANEGEADALIWELAAVDEELRAKTTQCDELEAQLGELRARLERENERSEAEIAALVRFLDADMQRLERLAEALRAPLDRAEAYVRETWEKRAALDPTPASSH